MKEGLQRELQKYRDSCFKDYDTSETDEEGNITLKVYVRPTWRDMAREDAFLSVFKFTGFDPSHTDLSRMVYAALSTRFHGVVTLFGIMYSMWWFTNDDHYPFISATVKKWWREDCEYEISGKIPVSEVFFARLSQVLSTDCLWFLVHEMYYDEHVIMQPVNWKVGIQQELDWMNSI